MTLITGNGLWDAAGTAMIGILLVAIAVVRAVETKSLLLGESATVTGVCAIEDAVPIARVIYLEPDLYAPRSEQVASDPAGPASR